VATVSPQEGAGKSRTFGETQNKRRGQREREMYVKEKTER
jgi:hypothetical protein